MAGWKLKAIIATTVAALVLPVNIIHIYSKSNMPVVLNQLVSNFFNELKVCLQCSPGVKVLQANRNMSNEIIALYLRNLPFFQTRQIWFGKLQNWQGYWALQTGLNLATGFVELHFKRRKEGMNNHMDVGLKYGG